MVKLIPADSQRGSILMLTFSQNDDYEWWNIKKFSFAVNFHVGSTLINT